MRQLWSQFLVEDTGLSTDYIAVVDPVRLLGNAATIVAGANRRPVLLNSLNHTQAKDEGGKHREKKGVHDLWLNLLRTDDIAEYLYSGVDRVLRAQIPGAEDGSFSTAFRAVIEAVSNRFVVVPNYGEFLEGQFKAAAWTEHLAMVPGLIYPRSHWALPLNDTGTLYSYMDCWHVPGLGHNVADAFVAGLLAIDQPRWTVNLIPRFEAGAKVEGRSVNDRPAGEVARMMELITAFVKLYTVYQLQYTRYWLEYHLPWHRYLHALVKSQPQLPAEVLRALADEEQSLEFLRKIPLHDLPSYCASVSDTVESIGHFGQKKTVLLAGMKGTTSRLPAYTIRMGSALKRSEVGPENDILANYIQHLLEPQKRPTWKDLYKSDAFFSLQEFAYALRSLAVGAELTEIVGILGWRPLHATGDVMDYFGADFSFSDGELFSKRGSHVALGLSPLLGFNNRQAYVDSVSIDKAFNVPTENKELGTGGQQEFSALAVRGYVDAMTGQMWERWTIPASAVLGEEGARPRFLAPEGDEANVAILSYYSERSPDGFLEEWYPKLAARPKELPDVHIRSWDPEAFTTTGAGVTREELLAEFLKAYAGHVTTVVTSGYMYRDQGFGLRIPVRRAKNSHLYYVGRDGILFAQIEQRGNVLFSGETSQQIVLQYGAEEIDTLVDMQGPAFRAPQLGGVEQASTMTIPEMGPVGAPRGTKGFVG